VVGIYGWAWRNVVVDENEKKDLEEKVGKIWR
jgi:hypothetical protein